MPRRAITSTQTSRRIGTVMPAAAKERTPEKTQTALPPCVIFDLDGTFAFLGDRSPYDASRAEGDEGNAAVNFVYQAIRAGKPETAILFVSGREEHWRPETKRWLAKHEITYEGLYLRRTG